MLQVLGRKGYKAIVRWEVDGVIKNYSPNKLIQMPLSITKNRDGHRFITGTVRDGTGECVCGVCVCVCVCVYICVCK